MKENKEKIILSFFERIIFNLLLTIAKSKELYEKWYKIKESQKPNKLEDAIRQISKIIAQKILLRIKEEGELTIDYIENNQEKIMRIIKEELEKMKNE